MLGNFAPNWQIGPVTLWLRPYAVDHQLSCQQLAQYLLGDYLGCPHTAVAFSRDTFGRPQVHAPHPGCDANWSHSGGYFLLGLHLENRLGVDIEQLAPRHRCLEIAERYFHPSEAEQLAHVPRAQRCTLFYRLWCAKEAVLKAEGRGIAFGLHKLAFVFTEHGLHLSYCAPSLGKISGWKVHELAPLSGFHAAIAYRTD